MKQKIFKMSDYKGKHFILQDFTDPEDSFDYEIGEISENAITDSWLENHVEACNYYGIPPYFGEDELLKDRINKIYESTL